MVQYRVRYGRDVRYGTVEAFCDFVATVRTVGYGTVPYRYGTVHYGTGTVRYVPYRTIANLICSSYRVSCACEPSDSATVRTICERVSSFRALF